jgi:4'-phosphopantetheinyl transferase
MPTGLAGATGIAEPALQIGDAVALVTACAGMDSAAHASCATGVLRMLTSDPALTVGRRPSGRPRLMPPHRELGVSLSARATTLGIGYCPTADVGVDIEVDDAALDPLRLARDHFSSAEAGLIAAAPDLRAARRLFLRLWCAKEAALKMRGRGVFDGLAEPDLSAAASELRGGTAVIAIAASGAQPPVTVAVRNFYFAGSG